MERKAAGCDSVIPVRNIYYMLAYAVQFWRKEDNRKIDAEPFENVAELMAKILMLGISRQIKRGLGRAYMPQTETLASLRGKVNLSESIKMQTLWRKQLVCTYDEFSIDSPMNRIIKSTVELLLHADISKESKKELRQQMAYFSEVDCVDLHTVNWNIHYDRNNQTYRMLIAACFLVVKGLLQTEADGRWKLNMDFPNDRVKCHLYEKFILGYYKKEFKGKLTANASRIDWQLDDENKIMLPIMQSDIMLSRGDRVLIIDAKFYEKNTQENYNKHTIPSGNLYQIFTYVKNKEAELQGKDHEVAGMLLYAKTDEEIFPNQSYRMSGNQISARTLDLNQPFEGIQRDLDAIARDFFCVERLQQ